MNAPIRTRPLGQTGLDITEVGLGGVSLRDSEGTKREDKIRVVHRALELGINYIDTAPLYGNSQEVLGEALDGRTEDYILGTKCGRWDWKTGPYRDLDAFKSQWEESLGLLRRSSVDILYIHEADWAAFWEETPRSHCHIDPDKSYDFQNAPVTRFLHWAREQGTTRHLGISGNNAHLLAKVLVESDLEFEVVLVAFQYSLLWRNAVEHMLPIAKEKNVGVVLGTPLQQGRLSVPREEWIETPPDWMDADLHLQYRALYDIQKESGLPLAELGIRYLLSNPNFTTVIPGAANVEELEGNVNSSHAGPLSPEIHLRLDALGRVFEGLYE